MHLEANPRSTKISNRTLSTLTFFLLYGTACVSTNNSPALSNMLVRKIIESPKSLPRAHLFKGQGMEVAAQRSDHPASMVIASRHVHALASWSTPATLDTKPQHTNSLKGEKTVQQWHSRSAYEHQRTAVIILLKDFGRQH